MTRHLHLPHPQLADRFIEHIGEGFWAGMFRHHEPAPIVPDGHDWDDFHWPDSSGYVEEAGDGA